MRFFKGIHYSVDFYDKNPELTVIGERKDGDPLYKWKKWYRTDHKIDFPQILQNLKGDYEWINCEFIEDKLIEVHFRRNPDFRYGNSVAIPIWGDEDRKKIDSMTFIKDQDYLRKGFYID